MKKIVYLVLAAILLSATVITVQSQPRGKYVNRPTTETKKADKPNFTPENRAEFMAKQLELSDAEKAKVQALFEKQDAKVKQRQEKFRKVREEHLAAVEADRKANETELIKIIGNEKFQQLQAQRIYRLEKMNKIGRRGGMNKMPAPDPNCPYYYNCPRR